MKSGVWLKHKIIMLVSFYSTFHWFSKNHVTHVRLHTHLKYFTDIDTTIVEFKTNVYSIQESMGFKLFNY